jgi:hypothetical protein
MSFLSPRALPKKEEKRENIEKVRDVARRGHEECEEFYFPGRRFMMEEEAAT